MWWVSRKSLKERLRTRASAAAVPPLPATCFQGFRLFSLLVVWYTLRWHMWVLYEHRKVFVDFCVALVFLVYFVLKFSLRNIGRSTTTSVVLRIPSSFLIVHMVPESFQIMLNVARFLQKNWATMFHQFSVGNIYFLTATVR